MEETRTAGGKEFVFSVLWAIVLLFIGSYIISALPEYKIIGMIITLLIFCVLGFFVLTRYSAIFTYSLKDDRLRINRAIGKRNKEVDFAISDIKSMTKHRPKNSTGRAKVMKETVFSQKDVYYVVYEKYGLRNTLVFAPSKVMADKILSRVKNIKTK